jgi:hypothetical protein
MENIKKFENSKFCYPGGWSTFVSIKVACARKWQTVFFIWVHVWKVRYICCIYDKISAGFYRVQILRKAYMKTLHFSPLVLFLLHYEFIFTPMRVPWNFHGISAFELFVLKRIFSYNTPYTLNWRCHNLLRSRELLRYQSSSVATT